MPKHHTKGPHFGAMDVRYSDPNLKARLLKNLRDPAFHIADLGSLEIAASPMSAEEADLVRTGAATQQQIEDARKEHLRVDWFGEASTINPRPSWLPPPVTGPLKPWGGTGWWRNWSGNSQATFRCGLVRALEVSMKLAHDCPDPRHSTRPAVSLPYDPPAAGSRTRDLPIDFHWICGPSRFEMYVNWNPHQVTVIVVTPGFPVPLQEFADDPPQQLSDWVAGDQGTIFIGQDEDTADGNPWLNTMLPRLVTHHVDTWRGGSGDWP